MLEKLTIRLHDSGQKLTKPRLAVFAYLQKHDTATVADLVRSSGAGDRASVYRTLNLYRRLGVVRDTVVGGQRLIELTDDFDSHHHHLSCTSCGQTSSVLDPAVERRLAAWTKSLGYRQVSHQIEIKGLCPRCAIGQAA